MRSCLVLLRLALVGGSSGGVQLLRATASCCFFCSGLSDLAGLHEVAVHLLAEVCGHGKIAVKSIKQRDLYTLFLSQ